MKYIEMKMKYLSKRLPLPVKIILTPIAFCLTILILLLIVFTVSYILGFVTRLCGINIIEHLALKEQFKFTHIDLIVQGLALATIIGFISHILFVFYMFLWDRI